jgi:TolA-binding protein
MTNAESVDQQKDSRMSVSEPYQGPQLRYRRFGGGYRREDVELALAELRLTLRQLDNDIETLRGRNRELEGERANARNQVEFYRAKEQELTQTMAAALRRATDIEDNAGARARELMAQAEEDAARIRADATRRIEETNSRFNELLRMKGNLLDAMRGIVGDFDRAISRAERGEQPFPGAPADPAEPVPAAAFAVPYQPAAVPPVSPSPARPATPDDTQSGEEQLFETRVELDVGPFADFAALSAFERSLVHLAKVDDVYVRRLADDRALIELTLSEPAPLLQTMRETLPYSIDVRSANRTRLVVNVTAQQPTGAR